jgi:hypothetical protein
MAVILDSEGNALTLHQLTKSWENLTHLLFTIFVFIE